MKQYIQTLSPYPLFKNIPEHDLAPLLSSLRGQVKTYPKDQVILWTGSAVSEIGIVLSGRVQIVKEDYFGNKNILTELSASEIFAETFVCASMKQSPVTVLSVTDCQILWIDFYNIMRDSPSPSALQGKLLANMLGLIAKKNLMLNQKIEFISMRTIREKLLAYFTVQMEKSGTASFVIPFSRQELADFLSVNRSALSRELCKMREEGIFTFQGNRFQMIDPLVFHQRSGGDIPSP